MINQQPDWVGVFNSSNDRDIRENALVLRAAGIDYQLVRGSYGFEILVAAAESAQAREELAAYAAENRDWATDRVEEPRLSDGWVGVLSYAVVLLFVAVLAQRSALGVDWYDIGKTQAGLIRGGQVWRTVTALCLHVDLIHLLGNLFFGGVVGLFAGRLLGSGRAWFTILVAGATGNFLNALFRPAEHTSIGASTAVFAGLGLLATLGWRIRRASHMGKLERWVPLAGSFALLGLLGTGEGRTDVPAHVFGFLCGVVAGLFGRRRDGKLPNEPQRQFLFGGLAIFLLSVAWAFALFMPPVVIGD